MIIGYARVSTQDQQTLRQIDQLKEFGCERISLLSTKNRKAFFEMIEI